MSVGGGNSPLADFTMGKAPILWDQAMGIANAPFRPFTGQLSPGVPQGLMSAQGTAGRVAGFSPRNVSPASSGVYGTMPQPQMMPMAAPAMQPQAAPAVMPEGLSRREQRQWGRGQRRNDRGRGADVPGSQTPGTQQPVGPTVGMMEGIQGLDAYMNPYIESVITAALGDLDRSRLMSLNQGSADAAMAGAWGGDRHGVADALTNEAYGRMAGDMSANLRMGGFDAASGLLMGDKDRLLQNQQFNAALKQQAGLANQAAGLEGQRINLVGAQTQGQLAGQQAGLEQAGMDRAYQEFLRQVQNPYDQQSALIRALGGVADGGSNWVAPSHPLAMSFGQSMGQSLGQGFGGGFSNAGLQLLGL